MQKQILKKYTLTHLTEGLHVQCYGHLSKGKYSATFPTTTEGWGGEEVVVTSNHDMDSLQAAPRWEDGAFVSDCLLLCCVFLFDFNMIYFILKMDLAIQ